ncbi:hypothetical protein Msil_2754 [Methylocella silvestris BL2]|uniref:Uncharacterized protein n=1 Tax=Methylocella silvestris (strain DSM 15510 / CIP 108128 / LMG 27833 / NCIMB 13906 / BL2) TaxID=395965 RepID=B8ERX7_METSB|nr:hypothetical protein [Methylocella silvestris]ACK51675.1 hypothetical protein Msil_2754 [Methylocella silvestris BL2]
MAASIAGAAIMEAPIVAASIAGLFIEGASIVEERIARASTVGVSIAEALITEAPIVEAMCVVVFTLHHSADMRPTRLAIETISFDARRQT